MLRPLAPLAVFTALLALPATAAACAACACGDPTLTVMGTGKSFGGRLRLSSEWRRRAERAPGTFGETRIVEDRVVFGTSWAPLDALQIGLTVPVVDRTVETATLARHRALHIGDIDLLGRWIVVGARGRATHQLGLTAGLRLPTGPESTDAEGRPLPLDAQPGNGAFMPSVGVWYGLFAHPWSGHLSVSGVFSGEGYAAFTPGAAGLLTAFGQYQWGTAFATRLGVDGRWTGRDADGGVPIDASGGPTVFGLVGGLAEVTTDVLVHATLRWPLVDARQSGERAEPSVALGVTLDL